MTTIYLVNDVNRGTGRGQRAACGVVTGQVTVSLQIDVPLSVAGICALEVIISTGQNTLFLLPVS